ncbi:asparaginase [Ruegeria sediminis]|uniref:Asparaginase n=2 Tax=Ruegeria sediminis TaxID=2583820 RepID=A0ABY2X033_9RHOB|nr:asparaginase [Ruegeria sediminis]
MATAQDTSPPLQFATTEPGLPSVAILATGGTIAERTDPKTGAAVPAVSARDLVQAVPGLSKLANVGVLQFSNIDSSQMTPMHWARLSADLDRVLSRKDISGAVVTHGTDTMAEGAFFVDVTLQSDKPVVFTGAMNVASSPSPDGPSNILRAVAQVLSEDAQNWGVTVTLNRYVNSARDVRKTQTTNVQTFTSGEKGYLGYVFDRKVQRFNDRLHRIRVPLPDPLPDALPDVPIIQAYAGSDGRLLRHAIDTGAKGLVVEGVGAGNVNAEVFEAIEYAIGKGLPVVVATRVYYGRVEPIYGDQGGGATLQRAGCILAGDLPASKARLLLIAGLMRHGPDADALRKLFEG